MIILTFNSSTHFGYHHLRHLFKRFTPKLNISIRFISFRGNELEQCELMLFRVTESSKSCFLCPLSSFVNY